MATYASLTDDQKTDIATYDTFLRGVIRAVIRAKNSADIGGLETFAAANVDPVLASVDSTELIPNATDLSGAIYLTQAECTALQTLARSVLATMEDPTNKALLIKAIGVSA